MNTPITCRWIMKHYLKYKDEMTNLCAVCKSLYVCDDVALQDLESEVLLHLSHQVMCANRHFSFQLLQYEREVCVLRYSPRFAHFCSINPPERIQESCLGLLGMLELWKQQ